MGSLTGGLVLLSTVMLAVTVGIYASYGVVIGVLNSFGRQQAKSVAMLVPSESQVGGD